MSVRLDRAPKTSTLESVVDRWAELRLMERIWSMDPTVWGPPGTPEISNRLGWLDLPRTSRDLIPTISDLTEQAIANGITDVVLIGMGGSSLAPEVFAATFTTASHNPRLTVIDSTHPDAVKDISDSIDPRTSWYVIASKSGTTLETMSLFRYFWAVATKVLADPGSHFIAITDPGSSLIALSAERAFRACVEADPNVGGRYSALTAYGLVPAGLIGIDLGALLDAAAEAAQQCSAEVPLIENPAFVIGATLATEALRGNDKVHIVATDPVRALPVWTEQLIAESTGKQGIGILPVAGGPYPSAATDGVVLEVGLTAKDNAGLSLTVDDSYDISGAMFVLELATVVAGEILGIQPFDQPDVQRAKLLAASAMSDDHEAGPATSMLAGSEELVVALDVALSDPRLTYIAIQAYVTPNQDTDAAIESLRALLDTTFKTYTTAGYGPRFLHSTGQLHKGGQSGGLFLQIVDEPKTVLSVPETTFSFNKLIAAQANGDRAALEERGRTVLTIGCANDVVSCLRALTARLAGEAT